MTEVFDKTKPFRFLTSARMVVQQLALSEVGSSMGRPSPGQQRVPPAAQHVLLNMQHEAQTAAAQKILVARSWAWPPHQTTESTHPKGDLW